MAINILGISAFFHDSAAALVQDGEIIAAAQEERFTRKKGDPSFPSNAVEYCLAEGGISSSQLDYLVFYEKPLTRFERLLETYLAFAPKGFQSFKNAASLWSGSKLHVKNELLTGLGGKFKGEVLFSGHHESHAASAFFPSPFDNAAILTLDAVGEWSTSSVGMGQNNRIDVFREMRFPHSLGMLYSAFTAYAGFKVNSGEYKLMGLAPYGNSKYVNVIKDHLMDISEDGSIWLDMSYFNYCHGLTMTSEKFHRLFGGPPRSSETGITQKDMDIAASIQVVCEEVVLRAARYAHEMTGTSNLVMAGGVALNCVANGKLLREGPFENVWVQPAAGDAGGSLGAALMVWHQTLNKPRNPNGKDSQKGSFLGPAYSNQDIGVFLDSIGASYQFQEDEPTLLDQVAELLSQEKIVGWFHGRAEFGPRSLGHRSILGDARSPKMQQKMNVKIKYRESFRPFAPCVLREFVDTIFETRPNEDSPYMLFVTGVREECRTSLSVEDRKRMQDPDLRIRVSVPRSNVPAVTHVDYSARIQTIDSERHGRFYRLLRTFHEITGCPVVVNTSFNIRGEPIVLNFEDAFRCFMATDMDCLVLENYVLMKENQSENLFQNSESYKAQYSLD